MPYVITSQCIDINDQSCVEKCPVEAISQDRHVPDEETTHIDDNEAFFTAVLPGRESPLGAPGGANKVGDLGVDTPLVVDHPTLPAT